MSSFNCKKCGEELLGAVNSCWRCGAAIVPTMPVATQPPAATKATSHSAGGNSAQTIQPEQHDVDVAAAEAAETLVSEPDTTAMADANNADAAAETPEHAATPAHAAEETQPDNDAPLIAKPQSSKPLVFNPQGIRGARRGSPFAGGAARYQPDEDEAPREVPVAPLRANYPQNTAAAGGAFGSLIMAALTVAGGFAGPYMLIGRFFPLGGILTCVLGIALGIWGLSSERRGFAIAGTFACCLLLTLLCVFGMVDVYTSIHGYRPWETAPAAEF